ncbi:MAG: aminotransferase class V-fold PLP-dependent enzyme [Alphaproteobacteria bacterium]|nr:aminotransferase class V-fold PLP-dependent enzyme [Alphaproteobacteria bacterium]
MAYLNHGTVGLTPWPILRQAAAWREAIESNPARFLRLELPDRLAWARGEVARFVGARPDDLVFAVNATAGCGAVLGSLRLAPGDEILLTDHGYGAVRHAAQHVAGRSGARLATLGLPFPESDPAALPALLGRALRPRTRLVVLDHITSETALPLPLAEAVALCRGAGVPVLVDGAHAPGHLTLDLDALAADWYVGTLHKWAFAPRGAAFLWARSDRQDDLEPSAISWGYRQGLQASFGWTGTSDPTPYLAAPAGLVFLAGLGGPAVRARNAALAREAAAMLRGCWRGPEPAVGDNGLAMHLVALPEGFAANPSAALRLRDRLLRSHRIEVPVIARAGRLWLRLSAQVYNELADYERLVPAIAAERG